jgi:hypothetical protein
VRAGKLQQTIEKAAPHISFPRSVRAICVGGHSVRKISKDCGESLAMLQNISRKRHYAESANSGSDPFGWTRGSRFPRRWQQQVGRHAEAGAQSLHHRHAQPLLAAKYFTDAARGAEAPCRLA